MTELKGSYFVTEQGAWLRIDLDALAGVPLYLGGSTTAGVYLNGEKLYTTKEVETLRTENYKLRNLLKSVEWNDEYVCPFCAGVELHRPDCEWAAAMKETE
jgi:hypothetical protein